MKQGFRATTISALAAMCVCASVSNAATIITATSDNFESGLGNWTTTGSARLYTFDTLNQPADDLTFNYAPGGNGAADLPKSGGTITLTNTLALATDQYENLTIAFDYVWRNGSTTRRLQVEYSSDGGANWFRLGSLTSGNSGGNKLSASASVTITEGASNAVISGAIGARNGGVAYNGSALTDNSLVRFVDEASAGADVRVYIDNVVVSGLATPAVPEASAALLGAFGSLILLRRRRA